MEEKPKVVVVGGGKLPIWKIITAAILYTIIAYYLFLWIKIIFISKNFNTSFIFLADLIHIIGFFLPPALTLSVITTKYIDVTNNKLTKEYGLGPFKKNIYKEIPELEYVSVFDKDEYSAYEVNIWYLHKGHRRFNVGTFSNKNEALDYGKQVAKTLKIDLLDATEKGNSKWIELDE